jgi:glyoxylase-like metal-dependent hydrolase (beta-lactamase superfamily II)
LTHSHWDHIADIGLLVKKYPKIVIRVHAADRKNLEKPGSDGLPNPLIIEPHLPHHLLKDGDLLMAGETSFQVLHTPGHTPGSVCFYSAEENLLISGDTLFKNSIGTISFPTANPDDMWPSLIKLAQLPEKTEVIPGHGEKTTIGKEKPMLLQAKEIFAN